MKTKLTIICGLFLGLLLLTKPSKSNSATGDLSKAWRITEVRLTSATIFNGQGFVGGVFVTSDTPQTGPNGSYVFLADTQPVANLVNPSSQIAQSQRRTPPLIFRETYTANTQMYQDFGDPGIYFSTGCTVYKNVINSGDALKAYIKWKQ